MEENQEKKMMPSKKGFFKLLKDTYNGWSDDDPFRQSAAIAYYAVFSLPALLVIIIGIAGFFFGKDVVNDKIFTDISSTLGEQTAKQVSEMVTKASDVKKSVIASIIGIITLIVGATGVFKELQKSLNQIWEVEPKPKQAFIKNLKDRLFSFGLVVSIGFLLLVSLIITSVLAAFGDWLHSRMPDLAVYLLYILNFVLSFGFITVLFALMFKILPDAKIRWRHVWVGAGITAFLFILGKFGLALYFGKSQPESAYGAAGSVILILLWVSYSCMILFFGAEFTKQFAERYGQGIVPASNAKKANDDCKK